MERQKKFTKMSFSIGDFTWYTISQCLRIMNIIGCCCVYLEKIR